MNSKNEETDNKNGALLSRALTPIADEFAEHSRGTGKELGEAALTVAKGVNRSVKTAAWLIGGTPTALIFAYERIKEVLLRAVEDRIHAIPNDRLEPPPLRIAGPTIEAMKFCVDDMDLVDLFANLLVTSMDQSRKTMAFPAFIEIIKQLSPDEARILKYLAESNTSNLASLRIHVPNANGYTIAARNVTALPIRVRLDAPKNCQSYVDNMQRLRLIEHMGIQFLSGPSGQAAYEEIEAWDDFKRIVAKIEADRGKCELHREGFAVSEFGLAFLAACVLTNPAA